MSDYTGTNRNVNVFKLNPQAVPTAAILLKDDDVGTGNTNILYSNYLKKLIDAKVPSVGNSVCFIGLPQAAKNATKAFMLPNVLAILEYCDVHGIGTLLVADSKYFGVFTGVSKVEDSIGYIYQCKVKGYEHINILPSLHYNILYFNPTKQIIIDRSLAVLSSVMSGSYTPPGVDTKYTGRYFINSSGIDDLLNELLQYDSIACDIESTGLRFERDEILTIAFATDEHTAYGIAVHNMYHSIDDEIKIKSSLRKFFTEAKDKVDIKYHNGLFDVKFLIRHLFMNNSGDFRGMYTGIDVLGDFTDTMIVTYLATNSTDRAVLGLKPLSMEFMGDYAVDVKDATTVDINTLLEYNAKDCCATMYVYNKYWPIVEADGQVDTYNSIFRKSNPGLLEMMMTGLPMDMSKIDKAKYQLEDDITKNNEIIDKSVFVRRAEMVLRYYAMQKYNETHKKQKSVEDFSELRFNPGSTLQLRILLFDIMGFTPIEKTETGESSTNSASIKAFLAQAKASGDTSAEELLEAILAVSAADKVNGTFMNAFKEYANHHSNGDVYLNGNLKLGGTASGRLSSNNPNLQNLPSNSIFGKLVKSCFKAPDGWLFCGADFSALEDRIGAILSGDRMKTLEFSAGMDGHSLRALAFFPEELPELDKSDPEQVNRIKDEYPAIRQKAKAPSFALQYSGTWVTIQRTLGCSKDKAIDIEKAYHELYSGLADFAKKNEKHAREKGYVNCAFGLRLRTPLLHKSKGLELTSEAAASSRSANNATTQSWGMLTNRAIIDFRNRLINSEYRYKIRLVNTIHDAIYILVKNEPEVIKFANDQLIGAMSWQDHPAIASDEVKLGAELDIGLSWDKQHTLKNGASIEVIKEFLNEHGLT